MEFFNNNSDVAPLNWLLEQGLHLSVSISVTRKDLSPIHFVESFPVFADLAAEFGYPLGLISAMTSLGNDTDDALDRPHVQLLILSNLVDTSAPSSSLIQLGELAPRVMLELGGRLAAGMEEFAIGHQYCSSH